MQSTITDESSRTAASQISAINEALAEKVGPQKFRIWFKNSTNMTLADGYLKVGVPNLFIASWIENHFLDEITQVVRTVTGAEVKITFSIDPELSGHQRRTQLGSQSPLVAGGGRTRSPARLNSPKSILDSRRASSSRHRASGRLKLSLETFVVGSSNELAYNAAKAVVNEQQSPFNPLFIHGGYGVGKTHLLQGICNAVCEKRPQTNWLYLSAEDFVNQFVLALKTKKLEAFRRRMRQTDLLAIDDIHFLASKPSTQEEFLHTFNTISLAGKQVVLACDAHPKMIGQLSEKLVNRFVSGMVVKIQNPDFRTRCQICRQYLKTKNLKLKSQIPESVITYIAENLRTNVRELEGALLKLIAYSALKNEKINLSMARAVMVEHLERCDPIVHVSDIESAVATYFGTTPANIHSSKKNRTVALARHFSMYLTRKHTKMSSSEVGRFMGNKNHATVLLACKKIEELLKKNAEIHWQGLAGNKVCKARTILTQLEASI
ncbi:MAG TPA: chromosomal replication initiator protein DnaA [Sedimentisphaerales bacterium]|nr:chromosomal replication initiator protein DnaA [Sedimentisphaerales bacterium]